MNTSSRSGYGRRPRRPGPRSVASTPVSRSRRSSATASPRATSITSNTGGSRSRSPPPRRGIGATTTLVPRGTALIKDYFAGFQYGTDVAIATGRREFLTIPILLPNPKPEQPLDIRIPAPPVPPRLCQSSRPPPRTPVPWSRPRPGRSWRHRASRRPPRCRCLSRCRRSRRVWATRCRPRPTGRSRPSRTSAPGPAEGGPAQAGQRPGGADLPPTVAPPPSQPAPPDRPPPARPPVAQPPAAFPAAPNPGG